MQYKLTNQTFTTDVDLWESSENSLLVKAARTPGRIDPTLIHYLIPARRGNLITNPNITEIFGANNIPGYLQKAHTFVITELQLGNWHCYKFEIPEGSYGFLFNTLSVAGQGKIHYAEYDENMKYLAHNRYDYDGTSSIRSLPESFIPVVSGARYIVFNLNLKSLEDLIIYDCYRENTLKLFDKSIDTNQLNERCVKSNNLDYASVNSEHIAEQSIDPTKTNGIFELANYNLVNHKGISENTYINQNGTTVPYNGYFTTDFIRITPGLNYYQAVGTNEHYRKLAVFDINHTPIPAAGSAVEQKFPINISEPTAAYIRFTGYNDSLSKAQLTQSEEPLPYKEHKYVILKDYIPRNSIDKEKTSFFKSLNLFNKDSEENVTGYYISSEGAMISAENYMVSHCIYIKPNTNYYIGSSMGNGIYTACAFDKDDNPILGISTESQYINIPNDNVYYIRCSFYMTDYTNGVIQLTESNESLGYTDFEMLISKDEISKGIYIRSVTTEPLTLVERVDGRFVRGVAADGSVVYEESSHWKTNLYKVDTSKLVTNHIYINGSCANSGKILVLCLDENQKVIQRINTDKEQALYKCMDVYQIPALTKYILFSSRQNIWGKEDARGYIKKRYYIESEYPENLPGNNKVVDLLPRCFGSMSITPSFTSERGKTDEPLFECVCDIRNQYGKTLKFITSNGEYLTAQWVYVIKRNGVVNVIPSIDTYEVQEDDFLLAADFYYYQLPDFDSSYSNGDISLVAVTSSGNYSAISLSLHAKTTEEPQEDNQLMTYKNVRDLIGGSVGGDSHVLNILNSDRICLIGDSYTESHFTVKNKAYVNKLSLFSDYNFMNVAVSGDIYTGQLNKIRSHNEPYGSNYAKYLPKYTMLCCFTNDIKYMDATTFLGCLENAINYVRALGSEPIICTEYHVLGNTNVLESGMAVLADKYKVMFFDIAHIVRNVRGTDYAPFWGGSHPGSRPNALESDSYEMYLENMERPLQSLKLFRLRSGIDYSNLDNITFLDNYQRARLFKEINVGHSALIDNSNVDNCTNAANSRVDDEYRILGDGGDVEFGNVALASFVLPLTANHVETARLDLGGNFNGTVYIRDAKATPFPNITMYQRFDYASGQTKPSVGDKYVTIRGGVSETFTVVGIIDGIGEPGSDGVIFCSPRANKYSDTSAGTLTKTSGSGPSTINFVYSSPGYMFPSGMPEDSCGHWTELTKTDGKYIISEEKMKMAMQLDRLDVLLVNNSTFALNDISLTFKGTLGKNSVRTVEDVLPNYLRDSSELISHPTFGAAGTLDENWNVTPTKVYEDITANIKTYPVDCSSKVDVGNGTTISTTVPNVEHGYYMLEVTARYFPDIYTDGTGNQITEDSFDYAKLKVILTVGNSSSEVPLYKKVNTHWKLCQFKLVFRENQNLTIQITSDDAVLEVAKVSMKKL